jgi:hypothetical protein
MSRARSRRRSVPAVLLAALLAAATESGAGEPVPGRILTRSGPDTVAVLMALNGAQRKLRQPECQKLLTDFRDGEGRTLAENLAWMEVEPADYITLLFIREGSGAGGAGALCQDSGVAAVTAPKSRLVLVCGPAFRRQASRLRENTLIHEMLHSLGLGENPPSSDEINARVARRCGT